MKITNGSTITPDLRDAWHVARGTRLGASEIASAIGINQYDSQLRLFLTKTGKLPPKDSNEAMEIGTALEPAILDLYQKRTGNIIVRNQVFYVSPEHDYLCATLDGVTSDHINVQAKNVGCASAHFWGPDGTDEIPHNVLLQVNQEMLCSSIKHTHVVALIGGGELRIYPIDRNERILYHIIRMGREFMDRVRDNKYPEPDRDRDESLIKYLFPACDGSIEFDEKQSADAVKWERLGGELKLLEIENKKLKMSLTLAMGEASQAKLTDGRTLYRSITTVPARTQEVKGYSFPVLRLSKETK